MPDGEPPQDLHADPDLFLRAAELEQEVLQLVAEVRRRARRSQELCDRVAGPCVGPEARRPGQARATTRSPVSTQQRAPQGRGRSGR
jgi:hypothetical protein